MADMRLRIDGLKEFRKELRLIDTALPKALQQENKEVANEVARDASGKFASAHGAGRGSASYRGLATQTSAQVAMGGARTPYTLGLDFGSNQGKHKKQFPVFVKGGRYLYPAIERARAKLPARYAEALDKVAAKAFPRRGV